MSSDDERYLDSLLNSAQTNSDPKSALSRMSSKAKDGEETLGSNMESGDIGELVNNANGNEDLNEIGELLNRLDNDEIIDDKMADLLDNIESPSDNSVPNFTVGNDLSTLDTRDPEEIALDEAIADAERMDAEIQSGKFNDASSTSNEPAPIVDLQDGDDALSEVAPEVIAPEDNTVTIESASSDADETPEEILSNLLDEIPGEDISSVPEDNENDSLSDVLDNMQDSIDGMSENLDNLSLEDIEKSIEAIGSDQQIDSINEEVAESLSEEMPDTVAPEEVPELVLDETTEVAAEEASVEPPIEEAITEELSIEEPLEGLSETEENNSSETLEEASSDDGGEESLDDIMKDMEELSLEGFTLDGGSAQEPEKSADGDIPTDSVGAEDDSALEAMEEPPAEEAAPESSDSKAEDDFDLNDLEASLDDLLGEDADKIDSVEGEVAELATPEETTAEDAASGEDVSIPDLDALMNSLASDEIEDIESTAAQDEEAGVTEQEELPKEEILEALTEDGFDSGAMEPSLDDLAAIPERGSDDEEESGGKGKKGKPKKEKKGLGALLASLFKTLTEEEAENEGLASLTDENQTVLEELAGEEKPKKEKKKKEKKPKKEKPKKEPKPKKEKPPKPKKEKKPKPPKEPGAPEKVMSPKKIAISGIFAASIGIFFMIPVLVLPERIANEKAQNAYTHKEYTTAYKMLYGKELTEDQSVVYEQSRVLAWAERYLTGYENYVAMNMKEEALDMLLMGMRNKEDLLEEAEKFGVEIQVKSVYDSIESLLSKEYGLSETDISEINSIKKERDYTIRLMEIVGTL